MLLAHRITKKHFQKIQHYEKKKKKQFKGEMNGMMELQCSITKNSLGKNDFNIKYVL